MAEGLQPIGHFESLTLPPAESSGGSPSPSSTQDFDQLREYGYVVHTQQGHARGTSQYDPQQDPKYAQVPRISRTDYSHLYSVVDHAAFNMAPVPSRREANGAFGSNAHHQSRITAYSSLQQYPPHIRSSTYDVFGNGSSASQTSNGRWTKRDLEEHERRRGEQSRSMRWEREEDHAAPYNAVGYIRREGEVYDEDEVYEEYREYDYDSEKASFPPIRQSHSPDMTSFPPRRQDAPSDDAEMTSFMGIRNMAENCRSLGPRDIYHDFHFYHNPEAHVPWKSYDSFADFRSSWPDMWKWDVEYSGTYTESGKLCGSWTCTPLEPDEPRNHPLTIANAPVVIPVEYQWPLIAGVTPPPDPRPSEPIDCRGEIPLSMIRDVFLTFEGSTGFYLLINGLLQIIVPTDFDTTWASSHLPHKYGGLKVCYIEQTIDPTVLPITPETSKTRPSSSSPSASRANIFRFGQQQALPLSPSLKLNNFIEARPSHRKEKYSGRIGLKVAKGSEPYVLMSTHVITEAILAKSHRDRAFDRDRFEKLESDWNKCAEIWAGNERDVFVQIGTIVKTFDTEAELYPNGFHHDVTLIKPTSSAAVKDITSPVDGLGWLNHATWASLRQQSSHIKILGRIGDHRLATSIEGSCPTDVLAVGEGIFLNQRTAAGNSKSLRGHDLLTWKDLVSRALLYRVHPDFDPPNGYSGIALYAEGIKEDGTTGPGIAGFQSFVQRSGSVQNFEIEGSELKRRLKRGRVAFYGAFEVPGELKTYDIL